MQPDDKPPNPSAHEADFLRLRGAIRRLLPPGVIGSYDHLELVEVIGTPRGGKPLNVFSIAVLGEGRPNTDPAEQPVLLPPSESTRIRIDGFKGWAFGVARTFRPLSALDEALESFPRTGVWALSGMPLVVGSLQPQPPAFAPPDGTVEVPMNRLLKNNFWAGSHVFRLADLEKAPIEPFFADRRRLQSLSDAIAPFVPLALAGLSDFLGDILIQLPVTVLVPSIRSLRDADDLAVTMVWNPAAEPRSLRVAARTRWDELLTGADVSKRFDRETRLAINGHQQPVESEVWDDAGKLLLAATPSTSTLKRIGLNFRFRRPEPRLFTSRDAAGAPFPARAKLTETRRSLVGDAPAKDASHWRSRRQELEETRRLAETREFVQYRPKGGCYDERQRALDDLRYLIDAHGDGGADLWDPYLTADDLLQTLFWCPHSYVRLRALTDGRDPPSPPAPGTPRPTFPDRQRTTLAQDAGNCEGLRLEYRTRRGPKGWEFHDRFLIFPGGQDGPLAWSLGTSINSLGTAHHILQRVSNAVLIAGAFEDLWRALDKPEHLIWRSW